MSIRIGIMGYGNLGRGMEYAVARNTDMELRYIFTRRNPSSIKPITTGVEVVNADDAINYTDAIDVMVLCGGSATDLPVQTPLYAKSFNVVDSFDTHAKIPEHYKNVDEAASSSGKTAVISAGWDPGLFSMNKLMAETILPHGSSYTFWGYGVSQGHSDAIRHINGVVDARQYTVPVQAALDAVRSGENPMLDTRQKHTRECYVVAEENADLSAIEREIVTMPHYFDEYDTTVHFITAQALSDEHSGMPHGGFVIRSGKTGYENGSNQIIEYALKLDSNPEFTSSVLTICARAAYKMNKEGMTGCKTILDIPPAYFSMDSGIDLIKKYL